MKATIYLSTLCLMVSSMVSAKQTLPDPTKPKGAARSAAKSSEQADAFNNLKLTAIMDNGQRKSAIINGRLMQVGQKFSGFTLLKIDESSVLMGNEQEQRRFALFGKTIKKEASNDF